MRFSACTLLASLTILPRMALADPEGELRTALNAVADTSYAWETTVRQKFNGETTEPRINPNAPLEQQGRTDPKTYTEITVMPARDGITVPVKAIFRTGDAVGQTPVGWLRRTEMRNVPGPDRPIDFEGQQVRLARALTVALKATALHTATEDVLDLMADAKSYRSMNGLVIAELRDGVIEKLWGDPNAKRAPEIQGTVIFKISDQILTEYHVVLAIGFPNSRTKKVAWSMLQWTTRFKGVGTTTVDPPAGAIRKLEE